LALLRALNPDLASSERPAWVRYAGTEGTVQVPVVYAGGLGDVGGRSDVLDLVFEAYEPLWTAVDATTPLPLPHLLDMTGVGRAFRRGSAGEGWSHLAGMVSGQVSALVLDEEGSLYAGGSFGGSPAYVAMWNEDDEAWNMVGSGGPSWYVNALAFGPGSVLYAGGSMDDQVWRYRAGSGWSSLELATSGPTEVNALVVGDDGNVYAGGYFESPALVTTHIAVHDPDSPSPVWRALDSGVGGVPLGVSLRVYALARGTDGKIYVGGDFTTPGNRVAVWDPYASPPAWSAAGDGLDGVVYSLVVLPDGRIVAGGSFTDYVAVWDGVVWRSLAGLSGGTSVRCLAVGQDGTLYAGGDFTHAGGIALPDSLTQWNGYAWFPLDIDLPGASAVQAVVVDGQGRLAVGYGGSGNGTAAQVSAVVNDGTAAAYPIVTVTGPGRVHELTNWTTRESVYLDLVLLAGEVLTVDLRPGIKSLVSSFRGSVIGKVIPGSRLASWKLVPGTNLVGLYVRDGDANTAATMAWYKRHWSVDAVG
jgi:hypothetical protein